MAGKKPAKISGTKIAPAYVCPICGDECSFVLFAKGAKKPRPCFKCKTHGYVNKFGIKLGDI